MNKSKRLYITLNPAKEKDLVILNFLKTTYSETETIKSILYQIATNRCNEVNMAQDAVVNINIKEEQKGNKMLKKDENDENGKLVTSNNIEVDDDIKKLFS